MKILIINGPNLNLVGRREPGIYGTESMDRFIGDLSAYVAARYPGKEIEYFQSNHEGDIIDKIQQVGYDLNHYHGIVINAGAYTHTSLAIADAIAAIELPVIEVHISNIFARETLRHQSMISPVCQGVICGFGLKVYRLAVDNFLA